MCVAVLACLFTVVALTTMSDHVLGCCGPLFTQNREYCVFCRRQHREFIDKFFAEKVKSYKRWMEQRLNKENKDEEKRIEHVKRVNEVRYLDRRMLFTVLTYSVFTNSLIDWLVGWLIDWLAGWLTKLLVVVVFHERRCFVWISICLTRFTTVLKRRIGALE